MTMGVFLTFRIHDFPDITVDGSFTAGAAWCAVLLTAGVHPLAALAAAFAVGLASGWTTAFIHTRFRINGLLSGILVMTALYSINLHVMGRSNIPLLNQETVFTRIALWNPGIHPEGWNALVLSGCLCFFWAALAFFFKTDLGIAMRVTGNNPAMAAANGRSVSGMTLFGVALANGFVGLSGAVVAQYQGFADIGMGIGTVVIGLAAVIIGEAILKGTSMFTRVLGVIVGSILFRFLIAAALFVGMNPIDLKLLTAIFVLLTLVISKSFRPAAKSRSPLVGIGRSRIGKKIAAAAVLLLAAALAGYAVWMHLGGQESKTVQIGVVQLTDNGLLNITRDALVQELGNLGYGPGKKGIIYLENAHGDLATVNTILDKFLQQNVDLVVTISTACTQAAINKIKSKPVVFSTIANPFIIGAGKSETDHLSNVTGVYGWVSMEKMLELSRSFIPGPMTIGAIWDPAQANSVFNVELLRKALQANPEITFQGATITSSAEVYTAAVSLVQKGIRAFVLSPDNLVYSAFDSVVKAAAAARIPIFIADVERLKDGALLAYGYDYTSSGIQAAQMVNRILKGEKPGAIPFERYSRVTIGLNLDVARRYGMNVPEDIRSQATRFIENGKVVSSRPSPNKAPSIGIVQFALEPNVELCKQGIQKALEDKGFTGSRTPEFLFRNAQAEISNISPIVQDMVRRKVDIIVPLSTPCVQAAARFAGGRPDVQVVFTYVYDPYRAGAARTATDHPANVTGVSCFPPIAEMLDLIRTMLPDKNIIGVVWNSSEANSESVLLQIRSHAAQTGQKILEATVTGPSEVLEASRSLALKGAQVFLNSGDNTLNVGFDSFAKVAAENKIPVFSVDSEFIEKGAMAVLGPDYYRTGYDGGLYLARILQGESPAAMPIQQTGATLFLLNLDAARSCGLAIRPEFLKKARKVYGKAGGKSIHE